MKYREMGRTGKKISTLGFGCMRFPVLDGDSSKIDEKQAVEMVEYALDKGVNYFDTAYPYHSKGFSGRGTSEDFLGRVLKSKRDKVYVATKLPTWLVNTREDMDRFLEEQLKALQTEHIDFYLLHTLLDHNYDKIKNLGAFEFLEKAKKEGKIGHIGFSFHDTYSTFEYIINDYDWEFCQIQYNFMDQDYQAGTKGLKLIEQKGMGSVIMEPLRGGRIVEIPESIKKPLEDLDATRTMADWALSWLYNDPAVSTVLSGMSTLEHVIENVEIADRAHENTMSEEELKAIEKVYLNLKDKIKIPCTTCGYCCPCPFGVDIRACFTSYNNYFLFDDLPSAQRSAIFQYGFRIPEEARANQCTECRQCEEHCPQGIEISAEMKKVSDLFDN